MLAFLTVFTLGGFCFVSSLSTERLSSLLGGVVIVIIEVNILIIVVVVAHVVEFDNSHVEFEGEGDTLVLNVVGELERLVHLLGGLVLIVGVGLVSFFSDVAGENVEERVDLFVLGDLLSLLLLGFLNVSGITSGLPCDGSSLNAVDGVGLLLFVGNSELVAFEVLVGLEVHLEGEALMVGVEFVLDVSAVSEDRTIFISDMLVDISVGFQNSGPEISDSFLGALDGFNVTRLVNFDILVLIVLKVLLPEGVLLEHLSVNLSFSSKKFSALSIDSRVHDLVLELDGTESLLFFLIKVSALIVEDLEGLESISDLLGHSIDVFAHAELSLSLFGISLFNHGYLNFI